MAVTVTSELGQVVSDGPISKLATVTGIDAKTTGATTLYTVPTGVSAVITGVTIRCTAADTVGGAANYSLGANSTDFNDFVGINSVVLTLANTCIDGAWYMIWMALPAFQPVYVAGKVFSIKITTGATATSQALAVDVFGYLI